MKSFLLKTNYLTYEGAVLNAINEAHKQNKRVIKIGLPLEIQKKIIEMPNGVRLKELFGIKIERSKVMQITTEFNQIKKS